MTNDEFQKKIELTKIRIAKIFELREKNKREKFFEKNRFKNFYAIVY